jgi:hypothetical protein
MRKYSVAAVMLGGLCLATSAMAQSPNMAYATGDPRSEYLVFLEKGNHLPSTAVPALQKAVSAAKAGKTVMVVGRADQAQVVKQEMVREGAPASAIVLAKDATRPLPKGDALTDTASRKVEIKF